MRLTASLVIICFASAAFGAPATEDSAPPADPSTPAATPAASEDATEKSEEVAPGLSEEDVLKALGEAAAAAEKEEAERKAAIASAREKAKGEKHESLATEKGKTYNKVTITGIDDLGIKIMHEAGTARIKFEELSAALQAKFGYDAAKAAEQLDKEKSIEEARTRKVLADLRAQADAKDPRKAARRTPSASPARSSTKVATDDPAVVALEAKIALLEAGIKQIETVADGYEAKAAEFQKKATGAGIEEDEKTGRKGYRVDQSKLKMAERWREKAGKEYDKITAARGLVTKYRNEVRDLKRGIRR